MPRKPSLKKRHIRSVLKDIREVSDLFSEPYCLEGKQCCIWIAHTICEKYNLDFYKDYIKRGKK